MISEIRWAKAEQKMSILSKEYKITNGIKSNKPFNQIDISNIGNIDRSESHLNQQQRMYM